jgi:hypothetical protein
MKNSAICCCGMLTVIAWAALANVQAAEFTPSRTMTLDGPDWRLATDRDNKGRDEKWFEAPRPEAKPATVPCTIQEIFPSYAGLAWYWKAFKAPKNPLPGGRYLLRFWKVDYKADVWVNGKFVGSHEDGDEPFVLDATDAVRAGPNMLAVRVLHPTATPIDGILQHETASGFKRGLPCSDWNFGGILDSVDLLVAPAVRIEDLYAAADWKSGEVRVQVNVRNSGSGKARVRLALSVAPAVSGELADEAAQEQEVPAGDTLVTNTVRVAQHRLWELDDPVLYRVTARLEDLAAASVDEKSDRLGFRDFRYEKGYFRLNGRRIFLRSAHILWTTPVKIHSARDREMLRRDILYAKTMGFNAIRYLPYAAPRCHLDLADELGIMIMQQSMSSWCMGYPKDKTLGDQRFDRSLLGIVRRDRNHPSITMWYFLNETGDGPVFRRAVEALPKVRAMDAQRVCLLNSGRWDRQDKTIGSLSNPGSKVWDATDLRDVHTYLPAPHPAGIIRTLRGGGAPQAGVKPGPLFLSEYGIGSALDLVELTRDFERLGAAETMDAKYYRARLDQFLVDWDRWCLAEVFGRPEDYFRACQAANGAQRTLGLNALRSNPSLVGHSMTGLFDHVGCGEGPITMFRGLKPGVVDAMRDGWAPLRWCLFAEPCQLYRGGTVRIEAVLANEDVLRPGDYEVEVVVLGPDQKAVFKKKVSLNIPDPKTDPPLALPVLAEDVKIDGPAGRYRLAAHFVSGAAAAGQPVEFYVDDPAAMPQVKTEITIWGKDEALETWLKDHGIVFCPLAEGEPRRREVILAVGKVKWTAEVFADLVRRIARGSTVIFLSPQTIMDDHRGLHWLPLARKGTLAGLDNLPGLYHRDDWARRHPIFEGLPCGGLMDWIFCRSIVPLGGLSLMGLDQPAEAVCGGINTCSGYRSGIYVGVYNLGAGRFIANALNIRENLGRDPVAERLLRNMLNYAARDVHKPLAGLPADFDKQLEAMRTK